MNLFFNWTMYFYYSRAANDNNFFSLYDCIVFYVCSNTKRTHCDTAVRRMQHRRKSDDWRSEKNSVSLSYLFCLFYSRRIVLNQWETMRQLWVDILFFSCFYITQSESKEYFRMCLFLHSVYLRLLLAYHIDIAQHFNSVIALVS